MFEIYRAFCFISKKSYIGLTQVGHLLRWEQHVCESEKGRSKNSALHSAIRKYSRRAFLVSVLEVVPTREEAAAAEVKYISKFNSFAPGGYNMTTGGDSGFRLGEPAKALLRDANLGKTLSIETRIKISERVIAKLVKKGGPLTDFQKLMLLGFILAKNNLSVEVTSGVYAARIARDRAEATRKFIERSIKRPRVVSVETRAKISKKLTGRKPSKETLAKRSAKLKGRVFSPEHCAAISVAKTGVSLSVEHCAAVSKGKKGKKYSKEHNEKFQEGHRRWRAKQLEKV